jgi:hypothetical protein
MRIKSFGLADSEHVSSTAHSLSSSAPTALNLSPELDTVFRYTAIRLKLERDDTGIPKFVSGACPSLWLRIRRKDGETRVEHLFENKNYGGCLNSMGEQKSAHGRIAWTFTLPYVAEDDFSLDITQEFDAGQGKVVRVQSKIVEIKVLDIKTLQRSWGSPVNGLAASVALDRSTYELGHDIPLHVATEAVLDNSGLVWGIARIPGRFVTVSIRDPHGQVAERELYSDMDYWSGDFTPSPYRAGEPWILEHTLREAAPHEPGVYALWVTWRPLIGLSETQTHPANFVVISNPVEFTIVDSGPN